MTIDSISGPSGSSVTRKAATTQPSALRNNDAVLKDIFRTQQKSSGVTALAVPQNAKPSGSNNPQLPRGSLVDVLA